MAQRANQGKRRVEPQQRQGSEKTKWSRSFITVLTVVTTGLAGVAVLSGNILSIRDNVQKLLGWEPINISVRNASAREIEGGLSRPIFVEFVVDRTGQNDTPLSCSGEGSRGNRNFSASDSDYSSLNPVRAATISVVGAGDQSFTLILYPRPPSLISSTPPKILNFRLNCSNEVTPWIPVNVTLLPPRSANPLGPDPERPAHSLEPEK